MLGIEATIPNKGKEEMEIPTHKQLIDRINAHLNKTGEKPSAFGRRVLGDSGAVLRLINCGTDPRLSTVQKIDRAIKAKEIRNASRT